MKSTYLLLSSLLYFSHSAIAVPSSQVHGIKPRDASTYDLNRRLAHSQVHPRADGPTCDKCDPVRLHHNCGLEPLLTFVTQFKCRSKKYRDKADCQCKSCLPGMKPDPTKTFCIPEKGDDKPEDKPQEDGDKKYREKKEGKWEETLKR